MPHCVKTKQLNLLDSPINTVENKVYIGDNLDVLKIIEKESIDFIYIDPPYNTNNKFSYMDTNDKWSEDIEARLFYAKEILCKEGVICISIDDNELSSLLSVCYKIFEKKNYVGTFITKQSQRSNAKHINTIHEYVVVFAKNKMFLNSFYIKRVNIPDDGMMIKNIIKKVKDAFKQDKKTAHKVLTDLIKKYSLEKNINWIKNYCNLDDEGNIFFAKDLSTPSKPHKLDIPEIDLHLPALKTRGWSTKEKFIKLHSCNRLCFKNGRPYEIQYLDEAVNNISSILDFYSRQGTNDLKKLDMDGYFDTPKPVELIKFLIRAMLHKDSVIMDFYAGSGTTAQAVYEVNKEDNISHKYILIQSKEKISPTSDVFQKLQELGISEPKISDVLLIRLNKFLTQNSMNRDFLVEEI